MFYFQRKEIGIVDKRPVFDGKESVRNSCICPDLSERGRFWAETHPPSKFHGNPFCIFLCKPTKEQSDTGEHITSEADVSTDTSFKN